MTSEKRLPLAARLLIFGTLLAGIVATASHAPDIAGWSNREVLEWLGLAVAGAVLEQFTVHISHGDERELFSLTDGLWVAGLLLASPAVLSLAIGTGILIGQIVRRLPPIKIGFNVGQNLLAIGAAELVFTLFRQDDPLSPRAWAAALLAMAAFLLVNSSLVALVIGLVEHQGFLTVLLPSVTLNLIHWAGNVALGVLGATIWASRPTAVPLLLVPLGLAYSTYRALLLGRQERDRMRNLYEAGRALLGPVGSSPDFVPFLRQVLQLVNAAAVQLVLVDGSVVEVGRPGGEPPRSAASDFGVRPDGSPLPSQSAGQPYVSAVRGAEQMQGVLVIYRERPLEDSERSLVDALGSQVYVRLENFRLYRDQLEQRTQLAEIISHTSDGIFVLAPDGRISSWNPAMERIVGYGEDEALGRFVYEVLGRRLEEGSLMDGDAPAGDSGGRILPIVRKDGVERWIRYTRSVVPDRDGGTKAEVVVAHDVTAWMEAEQAKADFVATVSHELRTPLTPLKGFLTSLVSGTIEDSPETRSEYYRIMLNQTNRLERLITDLLEVSRIESAKSLVDTRVVELSALIGGYLQEVMNQERSRRFQFRPPGVPVYVLADPFRVEQVLGNLLSNAMKYSEAARPVEVGLFARGGHAMVWVQDEGEGIPSAEQQRIFQRFYRVDSSLTRKTGGTGLGLYVAKRLVEAMEGRIWVNSQPGQGARFSFTLPLSEPASAAMEPLEAAAGGG
jgi:PAS domain S-box-containing protein